MKALSIRQPWSWAILCGGKRIENRDWRGCSYRGPLFLHVGKTCTRREYADGVVSIGMARRDLDLPAVEVPPLRELDRGGLVGICCVVDARPNPDRASGYEVPGALGLVLEDVEPLPFVPLKGALGLFSVWPHAIPGAYAEAWRRLSVKGAGR